MCTGANCDEVPCSGHGDVSEDEPVCICHRDTERGYWDGFACNECSNENELPQSGCFVTKRPSDSPTYAPSVLPSLSPSVSPTATPSLNNTV